MRLKLEENQDEAAAAAQAKKEAAELKAAKEADVREIIKSMSPAELKAANDAAHERFLESVAFRMADGGDKKRPTRAKYDEQVATQAAAKKARQEAGVAGPISQQRLTKDDIMNMTRGERMDASAERRERGDKLHASTEEYMQSEEDRVANLVAPSRLGGKRPRHMPGARSEKLNVEPVEDVKVKQESSDVRAAGQAALRVPGGLSLLSTLFGAAHAKSADALFKGALSSAADDLVKAAFSSAANAAKKESIADAAKAAKKEPIADAAKDDFAKKEHEPKDEVFTNDEVVFLQEMAARGDGAKSMVAADLLQERRQRLVEWMDDERGGSCWREASPKPADETAAQEEPEEPGPADAFLAAIAARGDVLKGGRP